MSNEPSGAYRAQAAFFFLTRASLEFSHPAHTNIIGCSRLAYEIRVLQEGYHNEANHIDYRRLLERRH